MKKLTSRRVFAYVIDSIIVLLITGLFSNIYILNPTIDEYNEKYIEYDTYIQETLKTNPLSIVSDEYISELSYDISKLGVNISIITLVVTFLYFTVFQYSTKGKTIGKLLFGIEVVSKDNKKVKFSQLLIRSLFINSIATSTILIVIIMLSNRTVYNSYNSAIQSIDFGIIITCYLMMIIRKDGLGLHDIIAGTNVIRSSKLDSEIIKLVESKKKNRKKEDDKK